MVSAVRENALKEEDIPLLTPEAPVVVVVTLSVINIVRTCSQSCCRESKTERRW